MLRNPFQGAARPVVRNPFPGQPPFNNYRPPPAPSNRQVAPPSGQSLNIQYPGVQFQNPSLFQGPNLPSQQVLSNHAAGGSTGANQSGTSTSVNTAMPGQVQGPGVGQQPGLVKLPYSGAERKCYRCHQPGAFSQGMHCPPGTIKCNSRAGTT